MRKFLTIFALLFLTLGVYAQDENLIPVVKAAFYDDKIYDKVFIDYKGIGEWPFVLPKGKYAFIVPDTTFQKICPNILNKLALGWARERKLQTMTLINEPTSTVFVSRSHDDNIDLLVEFSLILINSENAKLIFNTTSLDLKESLRDRYIKAEVSLKKKKGKWRTKRVKIKAYQPRPISSYW